MDTPLRWWTVPYADGQSPTLMDSPLHWRTVLYTDGQSFTLMDSPLHWWTVLYTDGQARTGLRCHSTLMDGPLHSWTVLYTDGQSGPLRWWPVQSSMPKDSSLAVPLPRWWIAVCNARYGLEDRVDVSDEGTCAFPSSGKVQVAAADDGDGRQCWGLQQRSLHTEQLVKRP